MISTFSLQSVLGYLITRVLPSITGSLTLFKHSVIGRWYSSNGIYKFAIGQKIKLKKRNIFGYGIAPEGIVKGYHPDGGYIIEMTKDKGNHFFEWMDTGFRPKDVERITSIEKHSKWNIEYQFKVA